MMQSIIKVRNHILIVTLILLSLSAKAQCTWSNYYYESFEYNTVIPYIIPGTTYQNTPQTYAGCVHAGSNGMYLNIVDGVTGLIYDQPFTGLCVGREYQFSLWTRDAFTSSNNLTFQVLDASNTIISSQSVITNSIWMNVNLPVFTANSSNIRFQIITNIPGTGGNDAGIDEISLAICTPTPSNYSLIQCAALGNVNLYSQITSGLSTNGVWSGPSTLQNGYQGTFVPGTNTNGTYTYTIDAGGTCPDSIATVQINLQNTPDINPLGPIAACSSYTLPAITGTGLSGNQHYYTGPNGTGSILNTGTSITSSQTIYMYAGTTGCSDNEVVEITISTPVTAGLDDQVNYCSSGQTINMNSFLSAGATTGGIWSETTVPPSGTFNSTNANWITNSSTSGTYTFSYTVPANGSCPSDIANFSIFIGSQNGLDLGNDTILCQGETIDFTVPPGYDYFSWNVTNGNPTTITVSSPTTVILETQNTTGNLVVNGDFESGNSGFSTGYGPGTGGSFGLLTNSSTYAVTTNPNSVHTNFVNCADVTPNGPGNMMVVNGSTTPNTQVWGQTVSINPNTNYNFSVWASSVENINATDLAQLQFYINNVQVGSVFSPTLLGCDWQQFFETWNSGAATSANISIVAQAISGNNDFAIDDISFNSVCIQRDTVVVNYSTEEIDAGSDLAFCANESEALTATANYPNPNFTWETGVTNATITPTTSGYFTVSAISPSGCFLSDSALVTITPMPWDFDIVDSQPTSCGVNSGAVFAVMNGTFNDPPYYTWNGPGANNPNSVDASVWQNLSSGWYYIQVESAGCYRYDSVFVDVSNPPVAGIGATPLTGDAPLNVNFTNSSTNATSYVWNFGNGNTVNASDLSGQQQTYTDPGVYTAYIVAEQGNCDDTAFVTIIVNVPPVPPIPPVIVPVNLSYPNVFTPNGDMTNDYFEFDLLNIKEIEVYVVNRWGETVFSSSDVNFKWDGKINGKLATEGVYTFVYKATGAQNENLEGQGFVHLIY